MSERIVLKSFAELADALDLSTLADGPADDAVEPTAPPAQVDGPAPDLAALLAELEQASATLATVARRDQETRALALRDLEQYDAVVAEQREAEQALERARQVRREAEALAGRAFAEEARAAASRVVEIAAQAEAAAAQLAEQRREEAERFAAQLDLEQLLAERRREEEAERAKAAETERARRLSGALAQAKSALEAGRFEEARGLLGPAATENPGNPEIASLMDIMRRRELAVKVSAAEDALWVARREERRDPAAAVARLEAVDVDGLPEELARQLFGEWARACSRLCKARGLDEPLRYAPDPGRGAVIAREGPGEPYVVVSALGLGPAWQQGSAVGERQVRRARPLR
jgi:tetratricopeptide (TPR) repeat protein